MLHCFESIIQMPMKCVCPESQRSDAGGGRCSGCTAEVRRCWQPWLCPVRAPGSGCEGCGHAVAGQELGVG